MRRLSYWRFSGMCPLSFTVCHVISRNDIWATDEMILKFWKMTWWQRWIFSRSWCWLFLRPCVKSHFPVLSVPNGWMVQTSPTAMHWTTERSIMQPPLNACSRMFTFSCVFPSFFSIYTFWVLKYYLMDTAFFQHIVSWADMLKTI